MKKKILFLTSSACISGAENVILTIIKALRDEYDFAYAILGEGNLVSYFQKHDINYYVMKKMNQHNLKMILSDFQPDIIHANDFKASILMSFSKFKGKKISHIHQCPAFIKTNNLHSFIYRFSIKKYDHVVSVSKSFIEDSIFQKDLKNKGSVIPNIIDQKRIDKEINPEFSIKYDLAYFGRLERDKNPCQFIDIVQGYKLKYNSKVKAIMIGNGSLVNQCRAKIIEYGLEKNIELVGFLLNPFSKVQESNIVIMPSKNEGFGLTAVESMYLGKPVLTSGVGGLKEIFHQYPNCICQTTEEYVEKIVYLEKNYKQYQEISKHIASYYIDMEKWSKYFKDIYNC